MIKVIFNRSNDNLVSFKIEGHAGYDDYGKDIVCSAVSAISQTTLNGFIEVLHVNAEYEVKDGFLSVSLSDCSEDDIIKCQVLMETMLVGLKSMELSNYGEYIRTQIEEV